MGSLEQDKAPDGLLPREAAAGLKTNEDEEAPEAIATRQGDVREAIMQCNALSAAVHTGAYHL